MQLSTRLIHACLLLVACAVAKAQPEQASETPEVIVVTGRLPGPPLWKVSNGDNVLWIFAVFAPIPADMQWESARVEKVLAEAEEYLDMPMRGVSVSLLSAAKLMNPINLVRGPLLFKRLSRDPDKRPLQQTLTPSLYQRFAALKIRYFPNNKTVDELRPLYAMQTMTADIQQQAGLSKSNAIREKINELSSHNRKLVRTHTGVEYELKQGYSELAERMETMMKSLPAEKELACFDQELSRMEVDLEPMKRRANAWAKGNIDEFRDIALRYNEENPCLVLMTASSEGALLTDLNRQIQEKWLAAAEQALARRHTSFAVLDISELMSETGLLAQLQAKGYEVRVP